MTDNPSHLGNYMTADSYQYPGTILNARRLPIAFGGQGDRRCLRGDGDDQRPGVDHLSIWSIDVGREPDVVWLRRGPISLTGVASSC